MPTAFIHVEEIRELCLLASPWYILPIFALHIIYRIDSLYRREGTRYFHMTCVKTAVNAIKLRHK